MASYVLFPPLVNSYEPAFVAGPNSSLRVYFSLSSLTSIEGSIDDYTVHAQIHRQDGVKVIDTKYNYDEDSDYDEEDCSIDCSTGIIINLPIQRLDDNDNYYYVEINNDYLNSEVTYGTDKYVGWIPGWVYKIQLRLSKNKYDKNSGQKPEAWIQAYSANFSEWSTVCYTKAISKMVVKIPLFEYNSDKNSHNNDTIYTIENVNFFGTIESSIFESNENYKFVKIFLYSKTGQLLEESGEVYRTEQSNTYFNYNFKTNFENRQEYTIKLYYETENNYFPESKLVFNFLINNLAVEETEAFLITKETDSFGKFSDSSIADEEDEGRVVLKLYSPSNNPWSGNLCIRRASQKDNFATWEDIKIKTIIEQNLNSSNKGEEIVFYDNTIESGVWYKYGIQTISKTGIRGVLKTMETPVQRLFNHSFLLGQNNKQLKLEFDNTISSYKHQIYDSKIDTLGSKYPFISRNAMVDYRTFSMSATITFNMDENNTFLTNGKMDLYKYDYVVNTLQYTYNYNNHRYHYDYTYERDFRNAVLAFLQDGKPKLFKSPTEGNMIVRLTDVNCTPKQQLDRMIYSVNMTVTELDENSMYNYLKYGLYNPGTYSTQFKKTTTHFGQISGKFKTGENGDNIFKILYDKYDSQGHNQGGYTKTLENIYGVAITINGYYYTAGYYKEEVIKTEIITKDDGTKEIQETKGKVFYPLKEYSYYKPGHQVRIKVSNGSNNKLALGNQIKVKYGNTSDEIITIYDPRGMYEFDSLIKFQYKADSIVNDKLIFLAGEDEKYDNKDLNLLPSGMNAEDGYVYGMIEAVDATIDYIYTISSEPYERHQVATQTPVENVGQFYEKAAPGTNIYKWVALRHTIESYRYYRHFVKITGIEIEANPHTVFYIKDATDTIGSYFEVNDTGILRLYELNNIDSITYVGRRYFETPFNEETISSAIIKQDVFNEKGDYIEYADADISVLYKYVVIQGTYKAKATAAKGIQG